MTANPPRLMFAAPGSGSGKTTVVCAVLQALLRRGIRPASFKCGPDYIDPMFHSEVIGAKSRNLDLFLCGEDTVRYLLAKNAVDADVCVLEGVMGFYDGVGGSTTQASSYHLAKVTKTPVVLVVNVRGMSLSVAALVKGFQELRADSGIAAILFNNCSSSLYALLKRQVETETGLPVLGYLPNLPDCTLESRHLGLITAVEVDDLKQKLDQLATYAAQYLDLDALLNLSRTAHPFSVTPPSLPKAKSEGVRVAIAHDRAFCFYYEDAMELLRELGAELIPFSPLADQSLPDGIDGLLLGGGYPELYAEALSVNSSLRKQVRVMIQNGLPTVAECGGYLYLHKTLEGTDGKKYPMVGTLDAAGYNAGKLRRFGYVSLTARSENMLCQMGESIPAHEFHYWDSNGKGMAFDAVKPVSGRTWECGYATETLYAGFAHLHFYSNIHMAIRFLECCRKKRYNP